MPECFGWLLAPNSINPVDLYPLVLGHRLQHVSSTWSCGHVDARENLLKLGSFGASGQDKKGDVCVLLCLLTPKVEFDTRRWVSSSCSSLEASARDEKYRVFDADSWPAFSAS